MFPAAYPHDALRQLYPDVFLLRGSIRMGPGMRMNRNMVIVRHEQALVLINPVRLDEAGLAELDKLGRVSHVLRLGDFHGLDDAFYLDRYDCEFWAQAGQSTYPGPEPDRLITADTDSPLPNSAFFIFASARYPEAALLLREQRLLITTDSVQYHTDWRYFSGFTKLVFKLLGFKLGVNIGPPWLKRVSPRGGSMKDDFEQLLALDFDALVAAHGELLVADARQRLRAEVDKVFA